jgi:RimJ/RimL family protein N-acetyltransferase
MDFLFSSQNYNIFFIDQMIENDSFYTDIIEILGDNDKNNLPPEFWDIETIDDAKIWLQYIKSQSDLLFIQSKFSAKTIGYIFVHKENEKSHLGYVLAKEFWNKGIATEVLIAFIKYCNGTKRWNNFFARVHKDNLLSIKLLEQLGFCKSDESSIMLFYEYTI